MHQQTVSELDHMDTHYEKIANAENKKNKNKRIPGHHESQWFNGGFYWVKLSILWINFVLSSPYGKFV